MSIINERPLTAACTLPDCDGYGHTDDADTLCTAPIAELTVAGTIVGRLDVTIELYDGPGTGGTRMSILGSSGYDETFLSRVGSREEALAFAARFHAVAAAIEDAASQLAATQAGRVVA